MQYRSTVTFALAVIVAVNCGGRVTEDADAGLTGSGTGAGTGGTTSGSGGAKAGSTTTGTGGATGGTGGTGSGGAGGSLAESQACSGPGECTVMLGKCCGSCGVAPIGELIGVNSKFLAAARTQVCPAPAPCPLCVSTPDPNVGARCVAGKCEVFDVSTTPEFSKCATSSDCQLRKGLDCCVCGSTGGWVAVSLIGAMSLNREVCAPTTACTDCAPLPPAGAIASCVGGFCRVVGPVLRQDEADLSRSE